MLGRDGLHRDVLLDIVERAGGSDSASYLTTGNVSFRAEPAALTEVAAAIRVGVERVVERPTPIMIRSKEHLVGLVEANPFANAPHPHPHARLVTMVDGTECHGLDLPIVSPQGDYHVFGVDGGEIFSITIDNGGRIRDPGGLIEKAVGEPVTTRAWGTIEKIVAKLR